MVRMSLPDREHPSRLLPEDPLPPYTYVPRQTPHPVSDPRGHAYGMTPRPATLRCGERWRESREYCRGIDLFNAGYYWEAHEVWESLWHAAGRTGVLADFFKVLIKLAAAGVKLYECRTDGAVRHAQRAAVLIAGLRRGPDAPRLWGINLSHLEVTARTLQDKASELSTMTPTDSPPVAGLAGILRPER